MAKYTVIKQVDFGPYTILGPSGLQSDQVPLNNYAPKIGDTVEGPVGTMTVHGKNITGIIFPISTNGAASTTGQKSIQIIPFDDLRIVNEQPVNPTPDPNLEPNTGSNTSDSNQSGNSIFSIRNIIIAIAVIIIIIAATTNNK